MECLRGGETPLPLRVHRLIRLSRFISRLPNVDFGKSSYSRAYLPQALLVLCFICLIRDSHALGELV